MNALLLMMLGALDGGVPMTAFATPKEAFVQVLATRPQILGVGEYHELKGAPKVPSAIRHFTAEALPGRSVGLPVVIGYPGPCTSRVEFEFRPDTHFAQRLAIGVLGGQRSIRIVFIGHDVEGDKNRPKIGVDR